MLVLILNIFFITRVESKETKCPIAPSEVKGEIVSTVSFNEKHKIYTYEYSLKNSSKSSLPLYYLSLNLQDNVTSISSPDGWNGRYFRESMFWNTYKKKLLGVGKTEGGFILTSSYPPGPIIYNVLGYDSNKEKEILKDVWSEGGHNLLCAGYFYNYPRFEGASKGVTIGPVKNPAISITLNLSYEKNEKIIYTDNPTIDPEDKGKLIVTINDSSDIDVSKINLSNITLGYGKAKPLKSKIENLEKDAKGKRHKKLILDFDLAQVKVRCNIDHVLILSGKIGDKELMGVGSMVPVKCEKRHIPLEWTPREVNPNE